MKIYISGMIKDDPNHLKKFLEYEKILKVKFDCEVVNPAWMRLWMPKTFGVYDYLAIDLVALERCDAAFFIDDWNTSIECLQEMAYCKTHDIKVIREEDIND